MPLEREPMLLLVDIIEQADVIATALGQLRDATLGDDVHLRGSVLWSVSVMGEAVRHLPAEFLDAHTEIEWRRVAGFRNFVLHTYERIDPAILDVTARERVPDLRHQVLAILRSEFPRAATALDQHEGPGD